MTVSLPIRVHEDGSHPVKFKASPLKTLLFQWTTKTPLRDPTVPGSFADYNAIPLKKREEVKVGIYPQSEHIRSDDAIAECFYIIALKKRGMLVGALVGKVCVLVYVV